MFKTIIYAVRVQVQVFTRHVVYIYGVVFIAVLYYMYFVHLAFH